MNINETIFTEISSTLYKYDCSSKEIKDFLTSGESFLERQSNAIRIIEGIMTAHGKKELLKHVSELARVEHGIQELEPWVRDHVVHALLSFLLGIYLNEKFVKPSIGTPVDDFQWKLAGLFHDVGYPIQIAKDIMKPTTAKINEIKRNLNLTVPDVQSMIYIGGIENLANHLNSFKLIQKCLNRWRLEINAKKEYDRMIESGEICHGIMSSLIVLYVIALMYHKYNPKREYKDIHLDGTNINWNQTYFDRDIVSACSAIYIHNLPSRCFNKAKIDPKKAPIAFLLKLSDCLQEWERPSFASQTGYPASQFDIKIDKGQLVFYNELQKDKKEEIKETISSTLIATDVQIS